MSRAANENTAPQCVRRVARPAREDVRAAYDTIRTESTRLAEPLSPEDQTIQTMPDVSPTKWHLAHTSWFFETFVLKPFNTGYASFDASYDYLFNSYYNGVGAQFPRPERGLLSRPGVEEIRRYRQHTDDAMRRFIDCATPDVWARAASLITLGLNHEEQHQELILTDIKHVMAHNPTAPRVYEAPVMPAPAAPPSRAWAEVAGGIYTTGFGASDTGFSFDNEHPAHESLLRPFRLATALVANRDYLAFIADGGYERPELWLSDGWALKCQEGWSAPLYWQGDADARCVFTLRGEAPLDPDAPVAHVGYYEADAYARWAGKRLPLEAEMEIAARRGLIAQLYDTLWTWTMSAYAPYPGYSPLEGAIGEYNGKFMCNQFVLKGGSCATPSGHTRATYRNFFPPCARWQFSGIRLAEDG